MSIYKKILKNSPEKQSNSMIHNQTFNQAGKTFEDILPELLSGEDADITQLSD